MYITISFKIYETSDSSVLTATPQQHDSITPPSGWWWLVAVSFYSRSPAFLRRKNE